MAEPVTAEETDRAEPMIVVDGLIKRFGRSSAVDGVSFQVAKGEIVGLLGPNGAGKTTTMRILSCFIPATGGAARISGHDIFTDSLGVRASIGYLPENVPLYEEMRVREYLRFRGRLKGMRGRYLKERVREVERTCGLRDVRRAVIRSLSKGYRQRVGLADCLVHEPELLILDEPTIGLDPNQIHDIRQLIRALAKDHTVLLSSHILSEVEAMCSRVLIMNKGRIVASDTPRALAGLLQGNSRVTAEVCGSRRVVLSKMEEIPGVVSISCSPMGEWSRVVCECAQGQDLREEIYRVVSHNNWTLRELTMSRPGLEDVFYAITQGHELAPKTPDPTVAESDAPSEGEPEPGEELSAEERGGTDA